MAGRPQEIFATLERHEVRYVLVGGVAAILHGAPHVTTDVDVVPEEVVTTWNVSRRPCGS